ncbi:E3 ubiquitin-protein ligase AIRP2-like isoform X2 [Diospyros lotus]|uniref:E3 ubiquitin-protein ligase AIRP2-like isoform X2 n=1 Tax=Diospyros lotus TaxID=55363 RepID=UPI0022565D27|nr:E3 ubiquitin-protein ligase AIRP2-like isoform X2 [Diospyros lotus]
MWQKKPHKSSYRESIKTLEADIRHANTLAASLPRDGDGDCIQMKLSYSPFAPFLIFLIEWMDCSCTDTLPGYLGLLHILVYKVYVDGMPTMSSNDRKASLREFYAVIYPSLRQLGGYITQLVEGDSSYSTISSEISSGKVIEDKRRSPLGNDLERDDECGICMETCTKMVLPDCGHSMCNSCFLDWNLRSQSCPFCRGCLKRISSRDLWVLISSDDVIDIITLAKEDLGRFYSYIDNLPLMVLDTHLFLYDYLI